MNIVIPSLFITNKLALKVAILATVVGLIAFTLSWNMWDVWQGPLPGYQVLLFPGNLTLIYLWHPLFTEELAFWPKLALLLIGQFAVVYLVIANSLWLVSKIFNKQQG